MRKKTPNSLTGKFLGQDFTLTFDEIKKNSFQIDLKDSDIKKFHELWKDGKRRIQ